MCGKLDVYGRMSVVYLHGGMAFSTIENTVESNPQSPFQFSISDPVLKCSAKWSTLTGQLSRTRPQKPQRLRISGAGTFHELIDQAVNLAP